MAIALMAVLAGYNVITAEQGELWVGLFIATAPVAIALINMAYSNSRGVAKAANEEVVGWRGAAETPTDSNTYTFVNSDTLTTPTGE